MSDSIASLGAAADSTYGQGNPPKDRAETPDTAGPENGPSQEIDTADLRLVIEDDQVDGAPVYKTIDGRTGAVVRRLPRAQVLRMQDAKTYIAGQLIKTRA